MRQQEHPQCHGRVWLEGLSPEEAKSLRDLIELCERHKDTALRPRLKRFLRSLGRREGPPVIIWTMGKVGSSSLHLAIRRARRQAIFVHSLRPSVLLSFGIEMLERGERLLAIVEAGARALGEVIPSIVQPEIVTAIRDPVERNISAFFQNLPETRTFDGNPDQLNQAFLDSPHHDEPLHWFERELKYVAGIDVFEHPFPHAQGWQILDLESARVLVVRSDSPNTAKEAALREYLSRSNVRVEQGHRTQDKPYGDSYARFRANVRFSADYLDRMYASKLVRHFWLPEEIATMRRKWENHPRV